MSAYENSFAFAGYDLGEPVNYGLLVVESNWPYIPKPRLTVVKRSQANGVITQGSTWDERRFELECAVTGSNRADVATKMENICDVLMLSSEGLKQLIFGWLPTKYWMARLAEEVTPGGREGLNALQFRVVLIAPDPIPQDVV
jgi:phage-related protein